VSDDGTDLNNLSNGWNDDTSSISLRDLGFMLVDTFAHLSLRDLFEPLRHPPLHTFPSRKTCLRAGMMSRVGFMLGITTVWGFSWGWTMKKGCSSSHYILNTCTTHRSSHPTRQPLLSRMRGPGYLCVYVLRAPSFLKLQRGFLSSREPGGGRAWDAGQGVFSSSDSFDLFHPGDGEMSFYFIFLLF